MSILVFQCLIESKGKKWFTELNQNLNLSFFHRNLLHNQEDRQRGRDSKILANFSRQYFSRRYWVFPEIISSFITGLPRCEGRSCHGRWCWNEIYLAVMCLAELSLAHEAILIVCYNFKTGSIFFTSNRIMPNCLLSITLIWISLKYCISFLFFKWFPFSFK